MIARTEKAFLDILTKKSVLLNPPASDKNPKLRPGKHFGMISGIVGIKNYLDRLVHEQNHGGVIKPSSIAYAKEQLAGAKSALEHIPGNELYSERVNKYNAQIKVYEAECRKANSLIQKYQKEEAAKEASQTQNRFSNMSGKSSHGKLYQWAGRAVTQKGGKDVFVEGGGSVDEFKKEQRELTLKRTAAKVAEQEKKYKIAEKLAQLD